MTLAETVLMIFALVSSLAYYFLGFNQGRLVEIRTRMVQREDLFREMITQLREHQAFILELAELHGVKLPPKSKLKLVPPPDEVN